MPNTKSAKKRLRQTVTRTALNRYVKSTVRSQVRKVREAVVAGDLDAARTEFRLAVKRLDKAAAKRVIHPNAVARLKSRLSAAIKKLQLSK